MARYRIIQWRDLPSLVEAMDGEHTVRVPLSQRFQDLIDALVNRTEQIHGVREVESLLHLTGTEAPMHN